MNTEHLLNINSGTRAYDILVAADAIGQLGEKLKILFPDARYGIITDTNVEKKQLPRLKSSLDAVNLDYSVAIVPSGERSKSMSMLDKVVQHMLDAKLERNDIIIALGGGVIGDLAGFAASIIRRGMDFVQVPTSLLAQIDSSIGGKTGINFPQGKNLVGTFHQPGFVAADLSALETLPKRQFRAGYAEMVKYGLIDDMDFFCWLEKNYEEIFAGGPARMDAIVRCCRAKARFVRQDEKERGVRALLNLGHTFGHALEAATGYSDRLLHGEAVAIGMVLAHKFSASLGIASERAAGRVENHLRSVGLPTDIGQIPGNRPDAEELMIRIAQDKKIKRGQLCFILTNDIGKAFINDNVNADAVLAFLKEQETNA